MRVCSVGFVGRRYSLLYKVVSSTLPPSRDCLIEFIYIIIKEINIRRYPHLIKRPPVLDVSANVRPPGSGLTANYSAGRLNIFEKVSAKPIDT